MFDVITLGAALGCALVAGILFIFSVCIMRALGTLPPSHGIAAMQSINVIIINPWFLSVFVGTAAACAIVLAWGIAQGGVTSSTGALAGSVLYLVGVVGITRVCNIPRNDALASVAPDSAAAVDLWRDYRRSWTRWNHVRTAAALAAALAFMAERWSS
jgi:uncharacterized membrane protein